MTFGQISLLTGSAALVAVTYLFGPLLPPEKKNPQGEAIENTAKSDFDFDAYREEQLKKLPEGALLQYKQLQTESGVKKQMALAALFEANNLKALAAMERKSVAEGTTADSVWIKAANELYSAAHGADNQELAQYVLSQAAACYENALELNPENTDAKINLAVTYLEGQTEPMKGVMLLREITDKDPGNITANLILGKYGIVSGQFDKAVQRFEKVLSVDSLNTDAYIYLAQAYESLGEKEKAIQTLEKCKSLLSDPDFASEINRYIEKLKNS